MLVRLAIIAFVLLFVVGCGHVENAAEEGQNAFNTGMRTKDQARDFAGQKESYDRQADEF